MNEPYTCAHCGFESQDEGRDRCECGRGFTVSIKVVCI